MSNKIEKKDNIDILKYIVLFEDFKEDKKTLKKIDNLFKEQTAKKGDIIIQEAEEGDELYIIKKGSVRILKNTLQNEPYTVVLLSAEKHIFFGEIGLLLNDKRSATVIAKTNCTLQIIFQIFYC